MLQRLHNNGITDERFMLACYLKGLLPSIRAKVLLMSVQTLAQAEQAAKTVEQSLAIDNPDVKLNQAISELQARNSAALNAFIPR